MIVKRIAIIITPRITVIAILPRILLSKKPPKNDVSNSGNPKITWIEAVSNADIEK